ncbi:hypothetical protein [Streptomyces hirsutus]|uniref:hypothetical protein n=1 Tax=Streptomyces hirsutus TaxID=35620 RepID=UPI0033AB28C1
MVEVPSEPKDEKDYVRNVQKYGCFGVVWHGNDVLHPSGSELNISTGIRLDNVLSTHSESTIDFP